jgi:hypothetical protein
LGGKHPDTTISAYNLLVTLFELQKIEEAMRIFHSDLSWLIDAELQSLSYDQKRVHDMLRKLMKKSDYADYFK